MLLRLPPQNKAHATFMQPLQCILQHHVANAASLYAHGNTRFRWQQSCSHSNAIRNLRFNTRIELRTQDTTTRCRTQRRNEPIRDRNDRSRNRRTHEVPFIAGCNHFTRKNTRFRAPAFSAKQNLLQHSCSHMQPSQCVLQHHVADPHLSTAHGNTRLQQPCSHSTAICNHRSKKRIELRTQEQPLVAEHREGTHSQQKRPQPQPPHTRGTFHRRLQPLYTEKYKVSCSGFLPKTKPMQHSCSHYNTLRSITWLTRMYLHTWQHQMTTIMQPFQCDPQPEIQETHRTTHTGTTTCFRTQGRNQFAHETTAAATAAHTRYL